VTQIHPLDPEDAAITAAMRAMRSFTHTNWARSAKLRCVNEIPSAPARSRFAVVVVLRHGLVRQTPPLWLALLVLAHRTAHACFRVRWSVVVPVLPLYK